MSESLNELFDLVSTDTEFALRVLEDVTLRVRGLDETLAGRAVRAHEEAALAVVRAPRLWRRRANKRATLLMLAITTWERAGVEVVESRRVQAVSGALRTAYHHHDAVRERVATLPELWQVDKLWSYVLRSSPRLAVRTTDELISARNAGLPLEHAPITWPQLFCLAKHVPAVGLLVRYSIAEDDMEDAELQTDLQWFTARSETAREALRYLCLEAESWLVGRHPRVLAPLIGSADPDLRQAAIRAVSQLQRDPSHS